MLAVALTAAALLGACAGSFLGVVIHRLPRGLSIVRPGSHCSSCGTSLSAYENIPILGWLLLRGRCRHCGTPIPISCLWLEVGVALATAGAAWLVLQQPELWCRPLLAAGHIELARGVGLAAVLLVLWLLIAAIVIDWEHLIIPDELTKGLQAVAIPLAAATGSNLIWPWNPEAWFRAWDPMVGWIGTPGAAAGRLGLIAGLALAVLAATLPLARRIYGSLRDPWEEREHRAMRCGVWWFLAAIGGWTTATIVLILLLGPAALANGLHPGLVLAHGLSQAVLGALVGWWLPWLVGLVGTSIFGRNAMGFGDVKLFAALGAFLGPVGTLAAFMLATVAGTVIGIPARLLGGGREMPFGPSLAVGAVLAVALGPWLLSSLTARFQG